jgi:4-amino-4-deoxy-L-arabinose transferase-like glycosyltransferase
VRKPEGATGTLPAVAAGSTSTDAPAVAPDPVVDVTPPVASMQPGGRSLRRAASAWLARYWVLLALIGVAMIASVVIRHVVYPAFSWNRDEVTYQWQVSVLRSRHLFGADGGFPDLFWPWLTGLNEHGFFSQYTLGWPVVMLGADVLFGSAAGAILVGVVAIVVGAYALTKELTRDHTLALVTTVLVIASPFFAVQSGVYLGYLFSTGIGLLFGAALLAGVRRDDRRLAAVAGALLGYLVLTRPFDAVLWGAAISAYALIASWGRWRPLVRTAIVAGIALVPFLVVTLAYNRAVTGSATQFPFTAKEPLDTFGFGLRRLMPHTPTTSFSGTEAVRGVLRNFFYFPNFLVGAWLGVAVAFVGLWLRRRQRSTVGLLAIIAVFPVGYSVFWGIRLSSYYAFLSAPLYLLPLYVPICILIATVIVRLCARHRRAFAAVLCVALAVTTVPFLLSRLGSNQEISRSQIPWREAGQSLPASSLVFVGQSEFLMHLNPFSRNSPQLDSDPLYATDQATQMLDLIAAYPDRTPFLELTSDIELGNAFEHPHPDPPTISIVPLSVMTGRQFVLTTRITATSPAKPIVASLRVGDTVDTRVLTTSPRVGQVYETQWRVGDAATAPLPAGIIPLPAGPSRFAIRTVATNRVDAPFRGRYRIQRFSYRPVQEGAELLVPPRRVRVHHEEGEPVLSEVAQFPDFDVRVVAAR